MRLLLLLLALATTLPRLAAPQQQQWLPLVYTKTTDGFDDHDVGGPTAMCVNDGDVVRLKGTAQCKENVRSCWEKGNAMFATLPPGCGSVSVSTVKLMKGPDASRPDAIPLGSEVEVGSDVAHAHARAEGAGLVGAAAGRDDLAPG
jgi:hypothetical protein